MAGPAVQPLEIWAGDDNEIELQLFEADGTTELDLTGRDVSWGLASIYDKDTLLLSYGSDSSGTIQILNPTTGLLAIYIAGADTQFLGGETYYHEVEVIDTNVGTVVTVLYGAVTIHKTILHAASPGFAARGFQPMRLRVVTDIGRN